jgi:hypothetical protein
MKQRKTVEMNGTQADVKAAANSSMSVQSPPKKATVSKEQESYSTRKALSILVIIFLLSILILFYIYTIFPEVDEDEKHVFKLPRDIDDAKRLGVVLSKYKDKYFSEVLGGVFVTYIL